MNDVYDLQITVEEISDGGDYRYVASSPDLPNLIVAGDSISDVLANAPQVARALIASMLDAGDPLPERLRAIRVLPFVSHVMVAV
jgi:predicted RNase H-like HicB family nuclease